MAWFTVYRVATGEEVSTGDSVPSDLELAARGYATSPLAGQPVLRTHMWDPLTLAWVARPAPAARPTLVERIMSQSEVTGLSATNRARIRTAAERVLGLVANHAVGVTVEG